MADKVSETFYPKGKNEWRKWLEKHHVKKEAVWLVCYKKQSGKPSITWSDAVDEALCFGWIDSIRKTVDEEQFIQYFGKRKASSTWSKINKQKTERLIKEGAMTAAGLRCIEVAKANGSWTILDSVEELEIPKDLEKAFKAKPGSKKQFMALSKSVKKIFLHRLVFAKRDETRQKRVEEVMAFLEKK